MKSRSNWEIGSSSAFFKVFNAGTLEEYKKNGVKLMELSHNDTYLENELDYFNRADEIFTMAAEYDVCINSIHLPFYPSLDLSSLNVELREKTVAKFKKYLKAAASSGIKIAVVHPSIEPITDEERIARFENSRASLSLLSEYAEDVGIKLAVENLPRTCLCNSIQETVRLLELCPKLYACFDTNHNLIDNNVDFVNAIGEKIITLHVSDYDFIDERHRLPTHGLNDWEGIISALEIANYSGPFMYETGTEQGKLTLADLKQNGDMLLGKSFK
jgi:sugar phosphate isomerase/epimerase